MVHFSQEALEAIRELEDDFESIAFGLFRQGIISGSTKVRNRRMIAWIGSTPEMLARVWYLLEEGFGGMLPRGATKERLLWALLLLKNYNSTEMNAAQCGGVDEKTFRKWAWWFLEELSFLESHVVSKLSFFIPTKPVILCCY